MSDHELTTDQAAAPIVLRRNRRFLAGVGTLQALFLIMILLIVWQGHLAYLVFAAAVLVTTAWATVAWLRARTELRPDGIWNQGIRRGELIPWADVDRVMRLDVPGTVVVVRRGGSLVKLAGVQGKRSAAMPTLDEITTMIEAQADRHRPDETGSPESAPPMVERRLAWGPVRSFAGVLAVIGAVFAALAVKTTWMAAPAAFFLGLAAFMVIATMRAYTRIGPDGIHNRALRKRVFIPWSDVKDVIVSETPPRTLRIVRHSGGATTLAAVRDSDAHPDGVGLDALADIIRDRAEALAPEDDTPPAEARPLSLRPSRRPLLWIVPLATASAASWWLMLNDEVFVVVGGYLLMVPLFLLVLGLKLIRGRTEADADGLSNRLAGRPTGVPWRDVDRFVVMPTLFGRIVQVARRGGKRVTLAAPRDGLLGRDPHFDTALETMCALAAPHLPKAPAVDRLPTRGTRGVWIGLVAFVTVLAVVLWHPWVEPWWPGRHEATKLPRACALLNTDTARRLAPYGAPGIDTYDDFRLSITSRCRLYTHTGTRLGMELDLKNRSTFRSGTDEAREDFERTTRTPLGDDAVQVGGLGDAAWRTVTNGGGSASVQLTVRRRNVIVEVDYDAPRPATQVIADAETVARETLRRIFG